jgi:hypothetical protein
MTRPNGIGNLETEIHFKLTERREKLSHKSYDAFDVGVIVGMKRNRASYEEIEEATGVFATTAKALFKLVKVVKVAGPEYQRGIAPGPGCKAHLTKEDKMKVSFSCQPIRPLSHY